MKDNTDNCEDSLQMKLASLATQYRSSAENSEAHHQALAEYYITFQQLVACCGKIIALDPDAELPDRLMPKEYVGYWLKK
jgi:hypothetical protein